MRAFIPGAGLGTRLRPLTDVLPKPLVPLYHQPLVDWALAACHAAGARDFAINTHHLPAAWQQFGSPAPTGSPGWCGRNGIPATPRQWRGLPLALFHEPILLDTGGALQNLGDWLARSPESVLVHNGDIFSTLPLQRLVDQHLASGLPATLALRSRDGLRNVAVNAGAERVTDLRGQLGQGDATHAFTGIYCIRPDVIDLHHGPDVVSVIDCFLALAAEGRLGAVVLDDGHWLDLGDPAAYLAAHRTLQLAEPVHPTAQIAASARVTDSVVGPGAVIGANACVDGCVIWPGARIAADAQHRDHIVMA